MNGGGKAAKYSTLQLQAVQPPPEQLRSDDPWGGPSFCTKLSAQATSEEMLPGLGEMRRTGSQPAMM
eukprot:7740740-Pyramimonas_sp.AAC.1